MALTDTMFFVEILVEKLKTFGNYNEFCIKGEFADVFSVNLKDPNVLERFSSKHIRPMKKKGKAEIRKSVKQVSTASTVQTGQTVLFAINIDTLISNMKKYPLELSLWSKDFPDYKVGSTQIPWSAPYFEYLNRLYTEHEQEPVCVRGDYAIVEEPTSKRMAIINMSVKLTHFKVVINSQNRTPSRATQETRMNIPVNYKPGSVLSTKVKDIPIKFTEETGIMKTIYSSNKRRPIRTKKKSLNKKETKSIDRFDSEKRVARVKTAQAKTARVKTAQAETARVETAQVETARVDRTVNRRFNIHLVRSETNLNKNTTITVIKSKSCTSIVQKRNLDILNDYIFGAGVRPFGTQVYCVSYFTVENDMADPSSPKSPSENADPSSPKSPAGNADPSSPKSPSENADPSSPKSPSGNADPSSPKSPSGNADPSSPKSPSGNADPSSPKSPSGKSETSGNTSEQEKEKDRYKFRICKSDCPIAPHSRTQSTCSLDITKKAAALITVTKCSDVKCTFEKMREVPTPPDDRILIDLSTRRPDCCERTEEMVAGMKAKMTFGNDPCYCECECQFGFMKKTTFCTICGGYEKFGEDYGEVPGYKLPFPCPIFHKINKIWTSSSKEGSVPKKRTTVPEKTQQSANEEINKGSVPKKTTTSPEKTQQSANEEDVESSSKKKKKKKIDDRFKFKYGFTGIPAKIGHSCCALPCVGTLGVVPKNMGWLWNCENLPGVKFRPSYKPGAVSKHVLRLLKIAKNPEEMLNRKKKKDTGKPKKPLKRPLLIVHKKDGEYTVTMETMRTFAKTRTFNQHPYEDKPEVTYTIGRTSEENLQRKIKKERAKRRLERLQRDFVQSAFRDMCQNVCRKTYEQALELLPDAEKPDCTCIPALPGPDDVDLDNSCSCEEDKSLSESDTDSDEWIVEFTPPTAKFDPLFKPKKLVTTSTATQYTYMDYKVKLIDRSGNPVPRYFKGPDGKQECSDLGGFWSAERKWLEINVDGFIGPDGRWAPHVFLGPDNEVVDGEFGKFQDMNGKWLVIGVDGYVEKGKWKSYAKPRSPPTKKQRPLKKTGGGGGGGGPKEKAEETWSCFGSVTPKQLSKMRIMGHGHDRKLLYSKLTDLKARGENVRFPEPSTVPRSNRPKGERGSPRTRSVIQNTECKHAKPSDKGIVAIDKDGNKKYFRKKENNNKRLQDRMNSITSVGIKVSPFHVPCYESFICTDEMKKRQYHRLVALAKSRGGDFTGVYGSY